MEGVAQTGSHSGRAGVLAESFLVRVIWLRRELFWVFRVVGLVTWRLDNSRRQQRPYATGRAESGVPCAQRSFCIDALGSLLSLSPPPSHSSTPHATKKRTMVVDTPSVRAPCAPAGPFVTRPFPPPALENVPLPYILDQLHNLAIHYWDKPETADCTIGAISSYCASSRRD